MNDELKFACDDSMLSKQQLWERKLLDLTLRNSLINTNLNGTSAVPLYGMTPAETEAMMNQVHNMELVPAGAEPVAEGSNYIHTTLDKDKTLTVLKSIGRMQKSMMEENGANALFLALGFVKWKDNEHGEDHFAPIMLAPVELHRHGTLFNIWNSNQDETVFNITLLELFKQVFNFNTEGMVPLPDEGGKLDVKKVLSAMREWIRQEDGWEVLDTVALGIFSFSKFVMWRDIHEGGGVLRENPLVSSLMNGAPDPELFKGEETDARKYDETSSPADTAIVLDVDSSQLEAIVDAANGKSFILHGPPGTGKSQTITNMIVNALYLGKRVLFVSEKVAALSVVESRLSKVGLAPFCLELHSNKATKKHFLEQIRVALEAGEAAIPSTYNGDAKNLFKLRQDIIRTINALHTVRESGYSLYDCITGFMLLSDEEIPYINDGMKINREDFETDASMIRNLDEVISVIGHPADHPLYGLELKEYLPSQIEQMKAALKEYKDASACRSGLSRFSLFRNIRMKRLKRALKRYIDIDAMESLNSGNLDAGIESYLTNIGEMKDWWLWLSRRRELEKRGRGAVISYLIDNHKSGAESADAFLKGFYRYMANVLIEQNPDLQLFSGQMFEQTIARYRKLTTEFQEETRQVVYATIASRIAMLARDPEYTGSIAYLKRLISTSGRGKSIRHIIELVDDVLPKICPCMLMSPISVAQYLNMWMEPFDLVIFDEASQIPTPEAVGSMARAKSLVVVGDPKQMPPTSFFQSSQVDEEDSDIDDLDSILEDCLAINYPSRYLQWHYRSQHESLVAFSNSQYYDGRLLTFPSVDDSVSKVGFVHVEGVYDKGHSRSNRAEAEAIVAEIKSRLLAGDKDETKRRSIGVVAFSKAQQTLIEDIMFDEMLRNRHLEKLAYESEEPLFIKNLENVQGDERDVILFSVGYGPDKDGKVSMNFGPLNNAGGERRLNVAVSRARYEMKVFSTMTSEMIDLERSQAEGVKGLKMFLHYAETGKMLYSTEPDESKRNLATDIAEEIKALGYDVRCGVGRSDFKVDIAVVDPANPERYLLGIMLDGRNYYGAKTVRDREIIRPNVLNALGWKLLRVWSVDWFTDKKRTLERIKARLK